MLIDPMESFSLVPAPLDYFSGDLRTLHDALGLAVTNTSNIANAKYY